MNLATATLLLPVLLAMGPLAAEDSVGLLEPLPPAEAAAVAARHEISLLRQTWEAKRYRLVRINADALQSRAPLRLDLFPDLSLVADPQRISTRGRCIDGRPTVLAWEGTLRGQPHDAEELPAARDGETSDDIYASITAVSIIAVLGAWDPERERAVSLRAVDAAGEPIGRDVLERHASPFYEVAADLEPLVPPATYRLQALPADPRIHLVMELDPERQLTRSLHGGPLNAEEREARLRWYEEFVESLASEPGKRPRH